MSIAQLVDIPVDVFGGRNTSMPPADLPAGASALNQDIEFPEGAVRTRAGLHPVFPVALPGLPNVNGLKTYQTPSFLNRLMVLDALGNVYRYDDAGTRILVSDGNIPSLRSRSITAFGREYAAFYDGNTGLDIPRQYDDTNFDRVSQVGPGEAPNVGDEVLVYDIFATPNGLAQPGGTIVASPNGLSESGNIGTVRCTAGTQIPGIKAGDLIQITGATNPAYNATYTVSRVISNGAITPIHLEFVIAYTGFPPSGGGTLTSSITVIIPTASYSPAVGQLVKIVGAGVAAYNGTWEVRSVMAGGANIYVNLNVTGLVNSGNGTVASAGVVAAGLRQVSVAFVTRQGYITAPAPPKSWTASGGFRAQCANIPIGPANVIARLLILTTVIAPPATAGPFYSLLPAMYIPDNTTTSFAVDFLDAALATGFRTGYLFGQQELGECASVGAYGSRVIWLGERAKVPNFVNLPFDGGWNLAGGIGASDVPLGWISDPTSGAGGSRDTSNSVWMDSYRITGNGASAVRGMITQSVYQDYLLVPVLRPEVSYSYRVRLFRTGLLAQGNFTIEVYSPSLGSLGLAIVPFSAMPTVTMNVEFAGTLMAAQTAIPADAVLRIYGSGTLTNNGWFTVDCLEIFPTLNPVNASNARVSYANNPDAYDGVTGNIGIRPNDGQTLRGQFPLRNNYYLGKDNYLCYVADDGVNEPASWAVNEVSATIGICGPNAVDWTEEWAVFAHRTGFYVCLGSDPIKVSQEIQEDASNTGQICWNSINWLYGHTIWVRINQIDKRILIGAPVNGATSPNVIFVMDYKFSSSAESIASGSGVGYSSMGRLIAHGGLRKWTIWNISAPCCAFVERPDGTLQDFYGNGNGTGKIYNRPAGNYLDDGIAMNSFWATSALPSSDQEQGARLRAHLKLFGYLSGKVKGLASLPGVVSAMIQTGPGYVQVTMTLAHGLVVGDWVIVSGASDPTYNGYRQVIGTPGPLVFVYAAVTTLPAAVGATVIGTLNVWAVSATRTTKIRGVQLGPEPVLDFGRQLNIQSERVVFGVGTSVPGANFQLEKLIVSVAPSPTMLVRGSGL